MRIGASWCAPERLERYARNVLILAILGSATYAAWLSDDYLIGLRQVINFTQGDGFSFNADNRVQTMTSPLWGILLVLVYLASDGWYGPLILSLVLSVGAVIRLVRCFWPDLLARRPVLGVLCLLLASKAFMDFTTSGLENPLAYAIISAYCALLVASASARLQGSYARLCALAGALVLTRYDYALLIGPSWLWATWQVVRTRALFPGLGAGFVVVAPWLVFSLVYYGTFVSNSYYAKVTTQIPQLDALRFGITYWKAMAIHDPVTLLILVLGAAFSVKRGARTTSRLIVAGVGLYACYLTVIGGDFMVGRFLSVSTLASGFVIVDALRQPYFVLARRAALLAMGGVVLLGPDLPIQHTYFTFTPERMKRYVVNQEVLPRIADEKNAYVGARGLVTGWKSFEPWLRSRIKDGSRNRAKGPRRVVAVECGGLGWQAFDIGLGVHVFDRCALADPFLSKLPLFKLGSDRELLTWGPGHYSRDIPPGYTDSLVARKNVVTDPTLARTYDDITLIAAGPLFSAQRWSAIARLVSGETVRKAAAAPAYHGVRPSYPARSNRVSYTELERVYFSRCMWEYSNRVVEPGRALEIVFATSLSSASAWLSAQPEITYRIEFYAAGVDVGHQAVLLPSTCGDASLSEGQVVLKPERGGAFDRLDIVPVGTHHGAGIGGLYIETSTPGRPVSPLSYKASEVPASTGTLQANGARAATVGANRTGHLMFGPYVRLAAGRYDVQIAYRGRLAKGAHNGAWDVVLWQGGSETRVAGGSLLGTDGSLERVSAPITVPRTGPDARLEIRAFFDGSGDLAVEGASVRPAG